MKEASRKFVACPECQGRGTNADESETCSICEGDGMVERARVIAKDAERMLELVNSGFAGVLHTGKIVDRREYPAAIPIQKNALLGVPEPKEQR